MFKKLWYYITFPYQYLQERKRIKARLEELRKRDPFIYK
jgi:hypothetical protein